MSTKRTLQATLDFSENNLEQFKNYLHKFDNFYNVNFGQRYEREKLLKIFFLRNSWFLLMI